MGAGRLSRKDLCLIQMMLRRIAKRQADMEVMEAELDALLLLARPGGPFREDLFPKLADMEMSMSPDSWNHKFAMHALMRRNKEDTVTVAELSTSVYSDGDS